MRKVASTQSDLDESGCVSSLKPCSLREISLNHFVVVIKKSLNLKVLEVIVEGWDGQEVVPADLH